MIEHKSAGQSLSSAEQQGEWYLKTYRKKTQPTHGEHLSAMPKKNGPASSTKSSICCEVTILSPAKLSHTLLDTKTYAGWWSCRSSGPLEHLLYWPTSHLVHWLISVRKIEHDQAHSFTMAACESPGQKGCNKHHVTPTRKIFTLYKSNKGATNNNCSFY